MPLDKYAGVYADSLYGRVQVRARDGRLLLSLGTRPEAELEHWHADSFRAQWPALGIRPHFVTFTIDHRGIVQALTVDAEGDIVFKRDPSAVVDERRATTPTGQE